MLFGISVIFLVAIIVIIVNANTHQQDFIQKCEIISFTQANSEKTEYVFSESADTPIKKYKFCIKHEDGRIEEIKASQNNVHFYMDNEEKYVQVHSIKYNYTGIQKFFGLNYKVEPEDIYDVYLSEENIKQIINPINNSNN